MTEPKTVLSWLKPTRATSREGEVAEGPAHIPHPYFKTAKLLCRTCKQGDEVYPYRTVPSNQHNPNRQYFACHRCAEATAPKGQFICWADGRGVEEGNPLCGCGLTSREDVTTGWRGKSVPGRKFWACAVGRCGFDEREDERVAYERWVVREREREHEQEGGGGDRVV
ncbi:hypothetical protein VPNG_04052 [Cytospora leucostoma]|uniref:Uncharacterized protein n=1 Tax=Cytospora leucostoma TaxID=1230097 RepID=A0A423XD08_9PEZI|nr:hypothetical protein VPNG_04052 [Cytospora leucostoma]